LQRTIVGVARDTGITEIKQLQGNASLRGRVSRSQPECSRRLAFAGLTQKDVKIVEFASYGAMWKGIVNNDADAGFATTITGPARELENSPRGIIWPPLPHKDEAGWARVQKVGAFFTKLVATCAPRSRPKSRSKMGNYPIRISLLTLRNRMTRFTPSPSDDRWLRFLQGWRTGSSRSRR